MKEDEKETRGAGKSHSSYHKLNVIDKFTKKIKFVGKSIYKNDTLLYILIIFFISSLFIIISLMYIKKIFLLIFINGDNKELFYL
jgi:hypothetical protein